MIAALIINIILLVVLLVLVIRGNLKQQRLNDRLKSPDRSLETSKFQEILGDAQKKADSIITQAQMAGLKIATETKLDTKIFEKDFSDKIEESISEDQQKYLQEMDKILTIHKQFLKELEDKSIATEQDTENILKARINELLFSLEQNLTSFLNSSEQQSMQAINLEIKSARSLIDTYRTEQLHLIDENIVAVLERTLSLVLKNRISLNDQLDLVYEALERAKVEKFFV